MNDGLICNTCGQSSVIEIELTLPDGSEVVFCWCHRCESKWWDRDGEVLASSTCSLTWPAVSA